MGRFWQGLDIVKFLAMLIALSFVGILFLVVVLHPVVSDNAWNLIMILGNSFVLLVGYYWGSSTGSKDKDKGKDETMRALTNSVTGRPPSSGAAMIAAIFGAGLLLLSMAPIARAADAVAPAAATVTAPAVSTALDTKSCTLTYCTGVYIGFNLAGIATNANLLGNGINGSLAAGGQNIGVQGGYQFWNGTFFFGPEVFADYTYGGSALVAGYSAPKYLVGEAIKFGGPLASFFGGIQPANTTGVSQVLLSNTISPYLMVGAAQRSWGTGILAGGGITFAIPTNDPANPTERHWFVDARYMNIQYTSGNQASPIQTVPQENIVFVGVNYKF